MANEIIKPHKFEVAKNNIHSLSKTLPNVSLQKFETEGGLFGWFNHKVTGDEINSFLVSPMQSILISQNSKIKELFNIADEVYKALESLDNEYIQAIIVAVKSAEIASEQAKTASTKANTASGQALDASRKAMDASTKATEAQEDIKRTIEALQVTVRVLKEFKENATKELSSIHSLDNRVNSINSKVKNIEHNIGVIAKSTNELESIQSDLIKVKHIKDIDLIWEDLKSCHDVINELIDRPAIVEGHKANLSAFHQQVDSFVEKVDEATSRIDGDIESLQQYRAVLESYEHLGDVDALWGDVEGHKADLSAFHQQVDSFVERVNEATARIGGDIESLQQYRALLESYEHLGDVDAIWGDVEGHKEDLFGLHKKLDCFIEETHKEQEKILGLIDHMEDDNRIARLQFNKKLKIAYWVGGSAIGLAITNYILQLFEVI